MSVSRPPRRYVVSAEVLNDTTAMLAEPGRQGLEAVVVWLARKVTDEDVEILAAYRPHQIAYASPSGLAVEVPPDAISNLIAALPDGVFVAARVHTHPTGAYHSHVDDQNMLIGHHGAISIVVPHFASKGIDFLTSSVNELRQGEGWVELSPREVTARFTIR